jgi:type VI secretion system protein ImpA
MAPTPTLRLEPFLAPIPGSPNPAGDPEAIYFFRDQFDEMLREEESGYSEDEARPAQAKKADWKGAINLASKTLQTKSKDLEVAARMLVALTQVRHFGGLRDGLSLLAEMVEQCWDRMYPMPGDDRSRAKILADVLDDPGGKTRFPIALRLLPILPGKLDGYGCLHIQRTPQDRLPVDQEDLDKAIQSASVAACETIVEELNQSREALQTLQTRLTAKLNSAAPPLVNLRESIQTCFDCFKEILDRKRPATDRKTDNHKEAPGRGATASAPQQAIQTREEAYRQLEKAAKLIQDLEPHSPIPYLVQRAVELGKLSFPELIRALIRDSNVLSELNRELGIKEQQENQSSS